MDELTFLDKDYERKINFLVQQFSRMWTRFNIFVTLESSLIGGKFLFDPQGPNTAFAILGLVLSLIWYVFGANDKYLVEAYRTAVEEAGGKLSSLVLNKPHPRYRFVGDTRKYPGMKTGPLSWRLSWCSITHLAALFPLLLTIAWIVFLMAV